MEIDSSTNKDAVTSVVAEYLKDLTIIGGIFVFFLGMGIAQEELCKKSGTPDERWTYASFLIFVASLFYLFTACCSLYWKRSREKGASILTIRRNITKVIRLDISPALVGPVLKGIGLASCTGSISQMTTSQALNHVNFPTQILMKSAKSVPVIVGSFLAYGIVYPWYDNMTVFLVTFFLVVYNFTGVAVKNVDDKENSLFGLGLLLIALCCDGITGPTQDKVVKSHKLTADQVMVMQSFYSSAFCFVFVIFTSGFAEPMSFLYKYDDAKLMLVVYVLFGACGQLCIYGALVRFGSLYLTLITTLRKFLSVWFSVIWNKHQLSVWQWISFCSIFLSLALQSVLKHRARKSAM